MKKLIYKGRTSVVMTKGKEYTEVSRDDNGRVWIYDDFDEVRKLPSSIFDQVQDLDSLDNMVTRFIIACLFVCLILLIFILFIL